MLSISYHLICVFFLFFFSVDALAGMLSISYHLNVTLIIFDANECWRKGGGGVKGEGWQWGLDSVVGSWMVGSKFFFSICCFISNVRCVGVWVV